MVFGAAWLDDLTDPLWFALMLLWPFVAILLSAFALVRHAEALAVRLQSRRALTIRTKTDVERDK